MAVSLPIIDALSGAMAPIDGYQESPLLLWPVALEEGENSSNDSAEGAYNTAHGSLGGHATPKIDDTTFASGRNTGTIFDNVSSTGRDDWKSVRYDAYALIMDDASAGQTWDWVQHDANDNLPNARIVVRRGAYPNGVTPTADNFFAYLHLNYQGSNGDYRLRMAWGKALALEYAPDGVSWVTVDQAKRLGNVDHYFETHGDGVSFTVKPYYEDNFLTVEVDGAYIFKHRPDPRQWPGLEPDPTFGVALPYGGKIRYVGMNGWTSLEFYAMRFSPASLTKATRRYGGLQSGEGPQKVHGGMGNAFLTGNGRTQTPDAQTYDVALDQDGQNFAYTLTASMPDAGDGLGSEDSPRLTDLTAIVPPVWRFDLGTPGLQLLDAELGEEIQTFNDQARTFNTSGHLILNNYTGKYSGSVGRSALFLNVGNGIDPYNYLRARGVTGIGQEGLKFDFRAPDRKVSVPWMDFAVKLFEPIKVEYVADGDALSTAVLTLATLGGIHPQYLQTIPLYVPPGASAEWPFGKAGTDYPFFILPRGTGLNPKFRFTPEMSAWSCLQQLAQQLGEPDLATGRVIPYYFGFRWDGQFLFEPYDPFTKLPVASYSDTSLERLELGDPYKMWNFCVLSSTEQMRTDILREGLDGWTNALDYVHIPLPDSVIALQGYARWDIERNANFASLEYLERVAPTAAIQAGIPEQIIQFDTTFWGGLNAADVILVEQEEELGGIWPFVVIGLHSRYGHVGGGQNACWTTVTARSIFSYF